MTCAAWGMAGAGVVVPEPMWGLARAAGVAEAGRAQAEARRSGTLGAEEGVKSRVRVERVYLEGSGPSARVVGLADGVGVVVEPAAGAVRWVWTGGFPDLGPVRPGAGKLIDVVKLPGRVRIHDESDAPVRRADPRTRPVVVFDGYDIQADAVEMRYRFDGKPVTDRLRALPGGVGLERRLETGDDHSTWFEIREGGEVRALVRDEQGRLVLDRVWGEENR
ncbi:MAG: hypothetical protein JNN01_08115 [Opitutaceae bacterium]|nr:hypothetical protein [Opitutaceae bacterium]